MRLVPSNSKDNDRNDKTEENIPNELVVAGRNGDLSTDAGTNREGNPTVGEGDWDTDLSGATLTAEKVGSKSSAGCVALAHLATS